MSTPGPPPLFRLYGTERSCFTGKLRPALRAKQVHFEEMLPTPEVNRDPRRRTGSCAIAARGLPGPGEARRKVVDLDKKSQMSGWIR